MKDTSVDFQREIANIAVKSMLSAFPRRRYFKDRLLLEIIKRFIYMGTQKYLENLRIPIDQPKNHSTTVTMDLTRQISEFATHNENGKFTVYDRLLSLIAPHLEGAAELKQALCYSLASTPDYPVHLLLIGEPATIKTELLEEARRLVSGSVLAGPRSTQAGLTTNATTGTPGALAKANGGLALIDELDKVSPEVTKSLYEAMESGRITLNSGTISREIQSKFTCIATANPKGDLLTKRAVTIRRQLLTSVPAALLSRFHLTFLLKQPTGSQLEETVTKILVRADRENPNLVFLNAYFETIKRVCPIVQCELDARSSHVREVQKFLSKKITESLNGRLIAPLSVRTAEALKRLCVSSARLRLSPVVERSDVENAMSMMKAALATWE